MTRRVLFLLAPLLLVPLLAVAWVGFAQGQSASEKDEQQAGAGANPQHSKAGVPYLPCEDPVFIAWEQGLGGDPGQNPELSKAEVLDLKSHFNEGLFNRDPAEMAPCIADRHIEIFVRAGVGHLYNNFLTQYLANSKRLGNRQVPVQRVVQFRHYIHLYVFGDHNDTVVMTGFSRATLNFEGKGTYGPRLYVNVFVRQHGRWMLVANMISDTPKGVAPSAMEYFNAR